MNDFLKAPVRILFLALLFPLALLTGFGRFELLYSMGAQWCALFPGLPGDYIRVAYYRMTLETCPGESCIQFGTFFSHSQAAVGSRVYIGSYCVLGRTRIGDRTQIASGVQILSGRRQHPRGADGEIQGSHKGSFETVDIGPDCWIGAGSIVMAAVGAGSTVGAGSVVVHPVPERSVVAGNPARVIRGASGELA